MPAPQDNTPQQQLASKPKKFMTPDLRGGNDSRASGDQLAQRQPWSSAMPASRRMPKLQSAAFFNPLFELEEELHLAPWIEAADSVEDQGAVASVAGEDLGHPVACTPLRKLDMCIEHATVMKQDCGREHSNQGYTGKPIRGSWDSLSSNASGSCHTSDHYDTGSLESWTGTPEQYLQRPVSSQSSSELCHTQTTDTTTTCTSCEELLGWYNQEPLTSLRTRFMTPSPCHHLQPAAPHPAGPTPRSTSDTHPAPPASACPSPLPSSLMQSGGLPAHVALSKALSSLTGGAAVAAVGGISRQAHASGGVQLQGVHNLLAALDAIEKWADMAQHEMRCTRDPLARATTLRSGQPPEELLQQQKQQATNKQDASVQACELEQPSTGSTHCVGTAAHVTSHMCVHTAAGSSSDAITQAVRKPKLALGWSRVDAHGLRGTLPACTVPPAPAPDHPQGVHHIVFKRPPVRAQHSTGGYAAVHVDGDGATDAADARGHDGNSNPRAVLMPVTSATAAVEPEPFHSHLVMSLSETPLAGLSLSQPHMVAMTDSKLTATPVLSVLMAGANKPPVAATPVLSATAEQHTLVGTGASKPPEAAAPALPATAEQEKWQPPTALVCTTVSETATNHQVPVTNTAVGVIPQGDVTPRGSVMSTPRGKASSSSTMFLIQQHPEWGSSQQQTTCTVSISGAGGSQPLSSPVRTDASVCGSASPAVCSTSSIRSGGDSCDVPHMRPPGAHMYRADAASVSATGSGSATVTPCAQVVLAGGGRAMLQPGTQSGASGRQDSGDCDCDEDAASDVLLGDQDTSRSQRVASPSPVRPMKLLSSLIKPAVSKGSGGQAAASDLSHVSHSSLLSHTPSSFSIGTASGSQVGGHKQGGGKKGSGRSFTGLFCGMTRPKVKE